MSGAVRWLPGGMAGFVGLVFALIATLLLALVAVQAPALSSAAPAQDWEINLEITDAYMTKLLAEYVAPDRPIDLREPKTTIRKDGTVAVTGSLAPGASVLPSPLPLPIPIPGIGNTLAVPVEIVLRPGTANGKLTMEIVRTQFGPLPIPGGLGRLLEGPINALIANSTQGRPFRLTGIDMNDGYMLVHVKVEGR